jgi:type I restriction enzyme R subunit
VVSQVREEVGFTKGRIIVRGKLVTRGQAKLTSPHGVARTAC